MTARLLLVLALAASCGGSHARLAPAEPSLRILPSGQVEARLGKAWVATKLWILPSGDVQIRIEPDQPIVLDPQRWTVH